MDNLLAAHEEERLEALYKLRILDTKRSEKFDRIVESIAIIFNVPICTITLIDKDREWHKAGYGLQVQEAPRDISFFSHALDSKAPFIVQDASRDVRFKGNPLVIGSPFIRFYAGQPIFSSNGWCVGVVSIIDTKKREFHQKEIELFTHLAAWAETEINYEAIFGDLIGEVKEVKTVLDILNDGVIELDSAGKVLYVNKNATTMMGIEAHVYKDKVFDDLFQIQYEDGVQVERKDFPTVIAVKQLKEYAENTKFLIKKIGSVLPINIRVMPIMHDGKLLRTVVVLHDITREEKSDKAKADFISLVSHQLRTPISIVRWYTERVLSTGTLTEEQRELIKEIFQSNGRMIELVDMIIGVSNLQLGRIGFNPIWVDACELVKSILAVFAPLYEGKKLRITTKCEKNFPKIFIDSNAIRLTLESIITNAIQYSPIGSDVLIDLSINNEEVMFTVQDHGCGIPDGEQSKVFTRLFRASNAAQIAPNGTGLGLYLAKSLVDNTRGKIWFTSKVGVGSTFYVSWPMVKEDDK